MMYRVTLKRKGIIGIRHATVFAESADEAVDEAHGKLYPLCCVANLEVMTCDRAEWHGELDNVTIMEKT
tara:strand:+ start:22558 stop:22764 length:207 start_codon:yes stop_codon:yes gene_type:complete